MGRGHAKVVHALREFGVDCRGLVCADFGCNVGGFTQALLEAGAATVYAVDTGYGSLAWTLRNDPRVVVMERTNALHAPPPEGGVDLVTIDLGWTRLRHAVPAAVRWLRPGAGGRIVALIKPHYELEPHEKESLVGGVLPDERAEAVAQRTVESLAAGGVACGGLVRSPIRGGASKGNARGNLEWLALLGPARSG